MSFSVHLIHDLAKVEPGSTAPVTIEVVNKSESQDRYEIEVEGIDPGWIAIPVPSFVVEPSSSQQEKFFLRPTRDAESVAGTYPFVVNIRSTETGEVRSVQGALEIQAFSNFSVDVQPKRGVISPRNKTTEFKVTAMNLGNSEQTLQMFAADPENLFAFEFESDQVIIGPGQQRAITLSVVATKNPLFASSRLQSFSVTGHSSQNPAIASKSSGQIEQKALITPGFLALLIGVIALVLLWIVNFPKPPKIDSLEIQPERTVVGQPVTIKWQTTGATSVRVVVGNWVQDKQRSNGTQTYVPDKPGEYLVEVTAFNGDQRVRDVSHIINVEPMATVPPPAILKLTTDSRQVNVGQSFMIDYQFSPSVVRAMLYPMQRELDVKEKGILLVADSPGKFKYIVKAFNSVGDKVEANLSITVIKPSKAKVVDFEVTPTELEPGGGTVAINFTVSDAAKIKIVYSGQEIDVKDPNSTAVQETGHREIPITSDTTFKLLAYDTEGVVAYSKEITVKVKKAESQDSSPDPAGGTGGTGN